MQTFSIGRDPNNQIVLNDNFVSRKHAQLIISDNGQVMIKDLSSNNGTFVNGNRVIECYLKQGDLVKCGAIALDWQKYNTIRIPKAENLVSQNQPSASEIHTTSNQQPQSQKENQLYISAGVASDFPAMVRNELTTLSAQKQAEFIEEYNRKKKSVALAYILLIIIFWVHYGYLRKWGLQLLFWFTIGGFGIWWFIDLFRTYGMVQDYNKDMAVEVMRNIKAISN